MPTAESGFATGKRRTSDLYARNKDLEFTLHARRRMSERHITEEQIVSVLEKPDMERQTRLKGCRRAERKLGARTFGVVYREDRKTIRIITVW
jgi:hypothetical protein